MGYHGRQTAVILRRMMERSDGSLGALTDGLKIAKDQGLTAEHVVELWSAKAADILEDLIPDAKFEKLFFVRGPQKVVEWRKPVDEVFARLYMGMNPGYAWRNLGSNMAASVVQGWSPFKPGGVAAQVR